jgi:hypothetical protein
VWRTPAEIQGGAHGVCGHVDISRAFGLTDHTDPGVGFPRNWFIERIRQIQAAWSTPPPQPIPPQEDEMRILQIADVPSVPALILTGHVASWIPTMEALSAYMNVYHLPIEQASLSWLANVVAVGPLPPDLPTSAFLASAT